MSTSTTSPGRGPSSGEQGSGSILTIMVALALSVLAWVGLAGVGALAQVRKAEHAADLTALAAAGAYSEGLEPCLVAAEAAQRNQGRLESCQLRTDGSAFAVDVAVALPLSILGEQRPLVRHATAGSQ